MNKLKKLLKKLLKKIDNAKTTESTETKAEITPRKMDKSELLHPFVGKNVLIRDIIGVQVGTIVAINDLTIEMKNSRRLWGWQAKQSIALDSVVKYGVNPDGTRATAIVDEVYIPYTNNIFSIYTLDGTIYTIYKVIMEGLSICTLDDTIYKEIMDLPDEARI